MINLIPLRRRFMILMLIITNGGIMLVNKV
nr:MAG TPA: hypothetical protein [Caudoviricetes sp.]